MHSPDRTHGPMTSIIGAWGGEVKEVREERGVLVGLEEDVVVTEGMVELAEASEVPEAVGAAEKERSKSSTRYAGPSRLSATSLDRQQERRQLVHWFRSISHHR
eukprot:3974906-Prymnesium_polylepis.1